MMNAHDEENLRQLVGTVTSATDVDDAVVLTYQDGRTVRLEPSEWLLIVETEPSPGERR